MEQTCAQLPHPSASAFCRIVDWILRFRIPVLVVVLLLTVAFGWRLHRLTFGTSVYNLVIEDLPENDLYREYKKVFGADEIIRIVVRADSVLSPAVFSRLTALSEKAAKIPGVRKVIGLPEVKKAVDPAGKMSLKTFAGIIAPVKLFTRNLISKDRRAASLTLLLTQEASHERTIDAVKALIADVPKTLSVYQIGMPLVSRALARYTEADFLRLPPLTLAIIACLLFFLLRSWSSLVLSMTVVILAQVWTFGLMAWTGVPLSMLTMIVPVFLIAVGTAYCLYLCSGYLDSAGEADSPRDAVMRVFSSLAFPTVLAVATTLAGIGSLAVNRIVAIREFSLFSCFGMASLLFLLLTFFPAVLSFFPLPQKSRRQSGLDRFVTALLKKIVSLNVRHQKVGLAVLAAVMAFFLVGVFQIRVETNPVEFFKRDTQISRHFHDIYKDLSGSFPVHVIGTGSAPYAFEGLEKVRALAGFEQWLDRLPGVDKAVSFVDYLKLVNYVTNQYKAEYYTLPEEPFELSMLINQFKIVLGDDMLSRFMNAEFSSANILLLTHISSSSRLLKMKKAVLAEAASRFAKDIRWDLTGFGAVMAASSHHLTLGQVKSLSIALVLIFAIMVMLFVSAKVGLIAVLPNLVPIITNFGLMGWFGIPLSIATSLIASVAIGLAVDDTIHYMVRYNNEFKKDLDKDRALTNTVMHIGRPIFFTTATISCGFLILMFSHFQPTAVFGLMMVITMVSAIVGDLVLLPSLMLHVELITAWDLLKKMPVAGGMPPATAHELRQPLNAIKVGNEFLKMMLQRGQTVSEAQLRRVVDEISVQVDRASGTITRLLEFGRGGDFAAEPVDLNRSVRDTVEMVENEMKLDNIELELELQADLPPVLASPQRIGQVVFNLLTNAREAIAERPDEDPGGENRRIHVRTLEEDDRVIAEIRDSGIGISRHRIGRIFEPFFSTKGPGKGLGLAISRQIVKGYGGRLEAASEEGVGTVVRIVFPAALPAPEDRKERR